MDDENFMTEEEIKELDMEEHQYHAKYKHKTADGREKTSDL